MLRTDVRYASGPRCFNMMGGIPSGPIASDVFVVPLAVSIVSIVNDSSTGF